MVANSGSRWICREDQPAQSNRSAGRAGQQFMFSVLKKRGLLDDETLVSFSEVTWVVVPELPAKVTKLIGRYRG